MAHTGTGVPGSGGVELLDPHTGYGSCDHQLLDLARSLENRVHLSERVNGDLVGLLTSHDALDRQQQDASANGFARTMSRTDATMPRPRWRAGHLHVASSRSQVSMGTSYGQEVGCAARARRTASVANRIFERYRPDVKAL